MLFSMFMAMAAAVISCIPSISAQVTTSCNPTKSTCPDDIGLDSASNFVDFTSSPNLPPDWKLADGTEIVFGVQGAELTFAKRHDAPLMTTTFNFFFGRVEYVVKAAPGTGIVSSMVLLSDDLDEIDWEFLGGQKANVQTNYFGKGFTGTYNRSTTVDVKAPQENFHTYALDWTPDSLVWSINGKTVRTLKATEADGSGSQYPQSPMKVSLSLWDAGDPDAPGTQEWAGGITPIPPPEPYTMYVKSVKITNANPGKGYQYTDRSGTWKSIKVLGDAVRSSSNVVATQHSTETLRMYSTSSSLSKSSQNSSSSLRISSTSSSKIDIFPSSASNSRPLTSMTHPQPTSASSCTSMVTFIQNIPSQTTSVAASTSSTESSSTTPVLISLSCSSSASSPPVISSTTSAALGSSSTSAVSADTSSSSLRSSNLSPVVTASSENASPSLLSSSGPPSHASSTKSLNSSSYSFSPAEIGEGFTRQPPPAGTPTVVGGTYTPVNVPSSPVNTTPRSTPPNGVTGDASSKTQVSPLQMTESASSSALLYTAPTSDNGSPLRSPPSSASVSRTSNGDTHGLITSSVTGIASVSTNSSPHSVMLVGSSTLSTVSPEHGNKTSTAANNQSTTYSTSTFYGTSLDSRTMTMVMTLSTPSAGVAKGTMAPLYSSIPFPGTGARIFSPRSSIASMGLTIVVVGIFVFIQ